MTPKFFAPNFLYTPQLWLATRLSLERGYIPEWWAQNALAVAATPQHRCDPWYHVFKSKSFMRYSSIGIPERCCAQEQGDRRRAGCGWVDSGALLAVPHCVIVTRYPLAVPHCVIVTRYPLAVPHCVIVTRYPLAVPHCVIVTRYPLAVPHCVIVTRYPLAVPHCVIVTLCPDASCRSARALAMRCCTG
jgi:hypothetical protein